MLGKVIGTCVATTKVDGLNGVRLLVVQPMNRAWEPVGSRVIAADTVQAGPGDRVFLVGSNGGGCRFQTGHGSRGCGDRGARGFCRCGGGCRK